MLSLRRSTLLLPLIVLAAACGGGGDTASTTPKLDPAVASRLAEMSEEIASSLDENDVCTAAGRADDLLQAVTDAINNGEIPPPFQEELTSRANDLVNQVNCPTTTENEDEERGKKKGKKKHGRDQGEVTVPTVTDTTPTDTTGGPGPGGPGEG